MRKKLYWFTETTCGKKQFVRLKPKTLKNCEIYFKIFVESLLHFVCNFDESKSFSNTGRMANFSPFEQQLCQNLNFVFNFSIRLT